MTRLFGKKCSSLYKIDLILLHCSYPVGRIAEKAVCRSVFLTTKTHSFGLFFGDFAHWVRCRTLKTLRTRHVSAINEASTKYELERSTRYVFTQYFCLLHKCQSGFTSLAQVATEVEIFCLLRVTNIKMVHAYFSCFCVYFVSVNQALA